MAASAPVSGSASGLASGLASGGPASGLDAGPAPGRRLVVEADGGSRGNPGPAGYGALVRDAATGELLTEVAEAVGRVTNNVAEYRGLIAGLRAAVAVDASCMVDVRMDSKLVVEQMSGRWQIRHEDMRALARQARSVLAPDRVHYTWIPRHENSHADRLANEAMDAAEQGRPWAGGVQRAAVVPPSARPDSAAPGGPGSAGGTSAAPDAPTLGTARARVPGGGSPGARVLGGPSSSRAPQGPDLGAPTTLVLVRHGRTALTEAGRFSGGGGLVDPGLSPAGQGDARRVAELLARLGTADSALGDLPAPDVLLASPMRRTRETAATIGAAVRLDPADDDGWLEAGFGLWDGLTYGEVAERWPRELASWRGSTTAQPPGGGESLEAVMTRVGLARERVVRRHFGQCVVIVTHVTPVRVVVQEALDAGPVALWRLAVAPCSATVVRFWSDGGAEVLTVNATAPPSPAGATTPAD